jgi:lipopolysaccharide assembly outer membrane protein LptD (OstA)
VFMFFISGELSTGAQVPVADTLGNADSIADPAEKPVRQSIDSPVEYFAADTIDYNIEEQKVYLFPEASITYKEITLKADYIEFDMGTERVYARGRIDTLSGEEIGRPEFTEGDETFECKELSYNFRTGKGFMKDIFTEQEGGYLHSATTKRHPNDHVHMKNGMYTTCDAAHPHFYLALTRAKSIPGDKIISGPAYLVLEDVPLPLGIPFGFFPSNQTNQSGFILPTYGEEERRGFYIRNGGFYLALSDYFDFAITGDVYTNGTWGLRTNSKYQKRYKFNGSLGFNLFENVSGEKGLENYSKSRDFSIRWSHSQDARANPYQNLRASVNFSTTQYDQNHTRNINNVLRSTKQSSVSYSRLFPNAPFNLSASASASQNSQTRMVGLNLPQASLNMNRVYPFKRKSGGGKARFYEKLQLGYSSTFDNRLSAHEDSLFTTVGLSDFDMAYQHNIPVSLPINFLGHFTLSPSVRYTGVLFTKSISPTYYDAASNPSGSGRDTLMIDTIPGMRYAHAYVPSVGMSFTPKIYGMYQFREKSRIVAIRHVISPSASFSYSPDMAGKVPDYYQEVQIDSLGNTRTYSLFDETVYRTPVARGRSGSINFNLKNNIEMKLKSDVDTVEETTKVKLLDNLNFSTNYNIFKDSMKWAPVRMSANTSFFKKKVNLRVGGTLNPYSYVMDENGRGTNINAALLKTDKRLARLTNLDLSMGMRFSSQKGGGNRRIEEEGLENDPTADLVNPLGDNEVYASSYVDFDIPWSISFNYNFRYTKPFEEHKIIQSLRFNGDFSLTPKWKIGFNSGYDFTAKKVSTTNLNIHRDLHCWEMQVSVVPFGKYRSYSFQINIKSAILKDLSYEKRDTWYDNF